MTILITPPTTGRLPSIATFDCHLSGMHPLTPPYEPAEKSVIGIQPVDWLGAAHPDSRSSHLVAQKFCEMICYLWFALPNQRQPPQITHAYPSPENSPPFNTARPAFSNDCSMSSPVVSSPSPATTLQMTTTPAFVTFVQKLLETTQVSQSVIVLSLHYIYRLKERNRFTLGHPGSEYRIAVVALMMANKFLDDNTYTNKTWSEVSKIVLTDINAMEREFLRGADFKLYVDKSTYASWLCLLTGLVRAQERACSVTRKSRRERERHRQVHQLHTPARSARFANKPTPTTCPTSSNSRARSTSPVRVAYRMPPRLIPSAAVPLSASPLAPYSQQQTPLAVMAPETSGKTLPPLANCGSSYPRLPSISYLSPLGYSPGACKRTAAEAFSPTSTTFSDVPVKRPSIAVQIPVYNPPPPTQPCYAAPQHYSSIRNVVNHDHSPVELPSFGRMSIASACSSPQWQSTVDTSASSSTSSASAVSARSTPPSPMQQGGSTLVTGYEYRPRPAAAPQNLYFYALAGSPMRNSENSSLGEEARWRKAKLRYHQPTLGHTGYYPAQVQSEIGRGASHPDRDEHSGSPATHSNPVDSSPSYPLQQRSQPLQQQHFQPPPTHDQSKNYYMYPVDMQSARTSPVRYSPPHRLPHAQALPHFWDPVWDKSSTRAQLPELSQRPAADVGGSQHHAYVNNTDSPVRQAPYANAGPPGVHAQQYTRGAYMVY